MKGSASPRNAVRSTARQNHFIVPDLRSSLATCPHQNGDGNSGCFANRERHIPSPSNVADGSLEYRQVTGPIAIADIKASMVEQGLTPSEVEAWVKETGSPTQFAFELQFIGDSFTHSEETPQMAMQVGESGTFTYSEGRLILSMVLDVGAA